MPRRSVGRELGRADVHAAVQLHGVGVDDLGRAAVGAQRLGEVERQRGLAGAGRADDRDERSRATAIDAVSGRASVCGPKTRQTDVDGAARAARCRPPGAWAGTAHDSASARSKASPARVRRTGRVSPAGAGDQEVRRRSGHDDADDVAGARDLAAGRHVEVHEAAVFGARRTCGRSRRRGGPRPRRRAPRPRVPISLAFSSPEMRSWSSVRRS